MKLKTKNGYDFFEVASALQKEIRRAHEDTAMFWALELAESYSEFLWGRLVIIANEDVGLASPETIVLIEALRNQYAFVHKKKAAWRIILANAVLALCRAKKTRLADSFMCAITHRRDSRNWRPQIPDYALDKHTGRGKMLGRGWEHWADEGCKIANEAGEDGYFREAMKSRTVYGKISPQPPAMPAKRKHSAQPDLFQ